MSTLTEVSLKDRLRHRIDNKTKPLGALGRLEEVALQIGLMQESHQPGIRQPHIVVFAGDHGIAAEGLVNLYPQSVTAQMVLNFLAGGAAINVFCRQNEIGLTVVDAGVNFDFEGNGPAATVSADLPHSSHASSGAPTLSKVRFLSRKIGNGTSNYLEGPAMSATQAIKAMEAGKKIVDELHSAGCNCIGLGEMGIGNTSSASLIMSLVTGIPIEECTGRGTGVSDEQLLRKKIALKAAFDLHAPELIPIVIAAESSPETSAYPDAKPVPSVISAPGPLDILQRVGGFEIAMMTGAYLRAAELRMIILVDGFITTAALLLAIQFDKSVRDFCIFSHTSGEQGHEKMLRWLDARPLLDLGMRLGEGTGAALALPIVRSALSFLNEMASFETAGVDKA